LFRFPGISVRRQLPAEHQEQSTKPVPPILVGLQE